MAIHVSARPALRAGAAILIAALVLTLGIAPLMARGSDHLDAPNLGSVHVDANDNLSVTKLRGPVDINDLYVFDAPNGRTVLALTVNPAVNLLGRQHFNDNVDYRINIDRNGDARADVTYTTTFGEHGNGSQPYTVKRGNTTVARGWTDKGNATGSQGVMAFAGTRSDPFFFDLIGFLGSVKGQGTDALGKTPTDFFAGLDTYAIVLEVPNSQLGGNGTHIGVWGQDGVRGQPDRPGRSAGHQHGVQLDRRRQDGVQPNSAVAAANGDGREVPVERDHHAGRALDGAWQSVHHGPGAGHRRHPLAGRPDLPGRDRCELPQRS